MSDLTAQEEQHIYDHQILRQESLAEDEMQRRTEDDQITASVYLKALSEQWNDTGITMDEARDWHKLPPIRQIQVVERMLSIVSLLTSLTEGKT